MWQQYSMTDYEWVHKEMQKSGVTLSLLWVEYCERCRQNGELPYGRRFTCKRELVLLAFARKTTAGSTEIANQGCGRNLGPNGGTPDTNTAQC